jgi:hypothetical protein
MHPTGVLRKADWTGPEKLFEPIFNALHNDKTVRPKDGNEFFQQIEQAGDIQKAGPTFSPSLVIESCAVSPSNLHNP